MKKPTKKQVSDFIKKEFPHIEFDGIKFEPTNEGYLHFKAISFGRCIGQANYPYHDGKYFENIMTHLKWMWK